jgi:hypothetical protein
MQLLTELLLLPPCQLHASKGRTRAQQAADNTTHTVEHTTLSVLHLVHAVHAMLPWNMLVCQPALTT